MDELRWEGKSSQVSSFPSLKPCLQNSIQQRFGSLLWFALSQTKVQSGQTKSDLGPQKGRFLEGKSLISGIFQVGEILQFGIRLHESSNRIPSLIQADPFQRLKPQDQLRIGEVAPWRNRNRPGGGEWGENGAWNVSMVGTRLMGFLLVLSHDEGFLWFIEFLFEKLLASWWERILWHVLTRYTLEPRF